jgi:hypothetical protein
MTDKTGGPAFPQHTLEPNPNGGEPRIVWQEGMTLRDYFAAKAMQTGYLVVKDYSVIDKDELAKWCFEMADAMLKAREL